MTTVATSPATTEAQAKTSVYAFLAGVLSTHPTSESVVGLRRMAEILEVPLANAFDLDDLDQDYMHLFVVPNPRYVAPYESVYRDRWLLPGPTPNRPNDGLLQSDSTSQMIKGLVMGDSTLKVAGYYVEAGVYPSEELPDHIANELLLMSYLLAREAESAPPERRTLTALRRKLRQEHLQKWVGELRERVAESDLLGFYTAALKVTELVLASDA